MGNPTNTSSYSLMLPSFFATAGRDNLSFISTELLDFLFVQSRSALVYLTSGSISKRSASIAAAKFLARDAVTPLAEKYATNFLLILRLHHFVFTMNIAQADNLVKPCFAKNRRYYCAKSRQFLGGFRALHKERVILRFLLLSGILRLWVRCIRLFHRFQRCESLRRILLRKAR